MKRTILLADDSPTIQRLVERTFEGSEFIIEAVSNGEAAVRKLEELTPSAVLADIYMPGKNGYEVCTHVKQHPTLAATPVVLLVGAFEVFDEEEARRAGADTWITKPFEPKQLTKTVAGLVNASVHPDEHVEAEERSAELAGPVETSSVEMPVVEVAEPLVSAAEAPRGESAKSEVSGAEIVLADDTETVADADLLGLKELFPQPPSGAERRALSEEEVEAIADRVIDRLSTEVVESIAWDIVPEVADRVMRDELKNRD